MTKREEILKQIHGMKAVYLELRGAYKRAANKLEDGTEAAEEEFERAHAQFCKVSAAVYKLGADYFYACQNELPEWAR